MRLHVITVIVLLGIGLKTSAQFTYLDTIYKFSDYNWEVTYNPLKLSDDKFLFVGYAADTNNILNIYTLNAKGDNLWNKSYITDSLTGLVAGYSCFDKEKNIIICCQYYNSILRGEEAVIIKADTNGNVKWVKRYPSPMYGYNQGVYIHAALANDSNQYMLVCTVTIDSFQWNFLIMKTDTNGNEISRWEYGPARNESPLAGGIQTKDGGFLFAGYTSQNDSVDGHYSFTCIYAVKTDAAGNELWATVVPGMYDQYGSLLDNASANAMIEDTDGYILCGNKPWKSNDSLFNLNIGPHGWQKLWIGKLSKDSGTIMWQKSYGFDTLDYAYFSGITATPDGNYALCGNYGADNYHCYTSCIYKVDHNGDTIWTRNFLYKDSCALNTVPIAINTIGTSGYLVNGYVQFNSQIVWPWVVTIDSNGYTPPSLPQTYTGIQQTFNEVADFKLYPNPTTGQLYLTINTPTPNLNPALQLYDVSGRLILNQPQIPTNTPYAIDISAFANGLYFAQLVSAGNIIGRGKVIKQ